MFRGNYSLPLNGDHGFSQTVITKVLPNNSEEIPKIVQKSQPTITIDEKSECENTNNCNEDECFDWNLSK
jgi:hypothetical protein